MLTNIESCQMKAESINSAQEALNVEKACARALVCLQARRDEPHVEGGLWYECDLCDEIYGHWWCDVRAWRCLPPQVHDKAICLSCFKALRKLRKLKAFA